MFERQLKASRIVTAPILFKNHPDLPGILVQWFITTKMYTWRSAASYAVLHRI
jgi:hypothetical protein